MPATLCYVSLKRKLFLKANCRSHKVLKSEAISAMSYQKVSCTKSLQLEMLPLHEINMKSLRQMLESFRIAPPAHSHPFRKKQEGNHKSIFFSKSPARIQKVYNTLSTNVASKSLGKTYDHGTHQCVDHPVLRCFTPSWFLLCRASPWS